MSKGPAVAAAPLNTVPLGMAKLGWFRKLNISARNCTLPCSPKNGSAVSFTTEKSHTLSLGPRNMSRDELPRTPHVSVGLPGHGTYGCSENINGLNQLLGSLVITALGSKGTKLYV